MVARQVLCPKCKTPVIAEVEQVFDTRKIPQARDLILSGQFNLMQCPACGYVGQVPLPIVYHDPDKELLLVYVPPELGWSQEQQEQAVGPLLQRIMQELPAEQRKAYLLQPQYMLTLRTLQERILEAEGITKDMLEAQEKRMTLLRHLLNASQEGRREMLQKEADLIDETFWELLTYLQSAAQATGDRVALQRLKDIEAAVKEVTPFGQRLKEEEERARRVQEFLQSLPRHVTPQDFVQRLLQWPHLDQDHLRLLTVMFPAVLEYSILQALQEIKETGSVEMQAKARQVHTWLVQTLEQAQETQKRLLMDTVQAIEAALAAKGDADRQSHLEKLATVVSITPELFHQALSLVHRKYQGQPQRLAQLDTLVRQLENLLFSPEEQLLRDLLETQDEAMWKALVKKRPQALTSHLLNLLSQYLASVPEHQREPLERLFRFLAREVMRHQIQEQTAAKEPPEEAPPGTSTSNLQLLRPGQEERPPEQNRGSQLILPT